MHEILMPILIYCGTILFGLLFEWLFQKDPWQELVEAWTFYHKE
jgi:hypothetical protein